VFDEKKNYCYGSVFLPSKKYSLK